MKQMKAEDVKKGDRVYNPNDASRVLIVEEVIIDLDHDIYNIFDGNDNLISVPKGKMLGYIGK